MADTKPVHVVEWLRSEAGRAAKERSEQNPDGSWKNSARRRSTLWKRAYMLNQAAQIINRSTGG